MKEYLTKAIELFDEDLISVTTPVKNDLFEYKEDSPLVDEERRKKFHSISEKRERFKRITCSGKLLTAFTVRLVKSRHTMQYLIPSHGFRTKSLRFILNSEPAHISPMYFVSKQALSETCTRSKEQMHTASNCTPYTCTANASYCPPH